MDERRVAEVFRERFGEDPQIVAVAPGRINLIGEHTDYNDGFVFPAAIDRGLFIAASPCEGDCELFSIELDQGQHFDAATIEPPPTESWSKYAAGMAYVLREAPKDPKHNGVHSGKPASSLKAVIGSDIPIASGVSSSAAIEMAFGVAWNCLEERRIANKELALFGQRCENEFIGLQSGIMDQMASAMGKKGQAMFLDTRSLDIQYAELPESLTIALCDTKKSRELAGSAYNARRAECEEAADSLGVDKLRDATLEDLEKGKDKMSEVAFRRARHVITENERCRQFLQALRSSDQRAMGDLMRASHASLRYDYEVTSAELDAMSEAANRAEGCVGARMTGAGFGGACVALVERNCFEAFKRDVESAYRSAVKCEGEIFQVEAAEGARPLT